LLYQLIDEIPNLVPDQKTDIVSFSKGAVFSSAGLSLKHWLRKPTLSQRYNTASVKEGALGFQTWTASASVGLVS
jgi:hypothetical protein